MKPKKIPKHSDNPVDMNINYLLCELSKYTHFSEKDMDLYYFRKRLLKYIYEYLDFITYVSKSVLLATTGIDNLKRVNREAKSKNKK